jgi:hypothetical protein
MQCCICSSCVSHIPGHACLLFWGSATTYNYLEAISAIHILTPSSEKRKVDFNWGSEKIRGVNIGGWLVLEP